MKSFEELLLSDEDLLELENLSDLFNVQEGRETMLDRIIAYDNGYPIFLSDIYLYEDFIGIEKSNGEVVFYQKGKR